MKSRTVELVQDKESKILAAWVKSQQDNTPQYNGGDYEGELLQEARLFLSEFVKVIEPGKLDLESENFEPLRQMLIEVTKKRTLRGHSAKEVAMFIFSLKNTLLYFLQEEYGNKIEVLLEEIKHLNALIDELGTIIYDAFINDREEIIQRQREELMEAATPVIKLWEGILCVPIIGTIDSQRSQQIMDTLLNAINDTGYEIAIIDISGVSTLDTLTAQHIMKTASATRLMGATCIISGISPAIARTIISLDIDLGNTKTKGTMSEAIKLALQILNRKQDLDYGKSSNSENGKSVISYHSG